MNEQDKQVIERLAKLLGWRKIYWNKDYHLCGSRHSTETGSAVRCDFPPSRLDGDSMLWLQKEMEPYDLVLQVFWLSASEMYSVSWAKKNEPLTSWGVACAAVDDQPLAAAQSAVRALKNPCEGKE